MSSWQEQVAEAHAEVVNDIKGKFKQFSGGPSVFEGIKAFCAAVNWSEKWIIGLLAIQLILFIIVIAFRKKPVFQASVFFSSVAIIFNAERINSLAARHWQTFATQNYFQSHGTFTSALLSAPLLLTMFTVLINYLMEMVLLMVEMKRKELVYKARQRGKSGGKTAPTRETHGSNKKKLIDSKMD
ncbi:hypothetical protein Ndes2526B_g04864 [Nannochloris sp. 'desiccata']|nr:putative Transmembrane protein 18 [Chlorella desiccata (nom. nud.)]